MSATIPERALLSDLLKPTGYDCPEDLAGKTFAAATSTKLYAWVCGDLAEYDYKELAVAPADLSAFKASKRIEVSTLLNLQVTTEAAYSRHANITSYVRNSDTSFTIIDDGDEYIFERDATKDITLW